MIVTINSLTINDPASSTGVYLDKIDGLDLPAIRTSSGTYSGRDGGYVGPQFYGPRSITLTGRIFSSDLNTFETARASLIDATKSKTITLQVVTNAGHAYIIYCNLIDLQMPIDREPFSASFKIELLSGDAVIYDNATGTPLVASIPLAAKGGYVYKVVYPVVYAAGSAPTTVNNAGSVRIYPVITLTGSMTNPQIQNVTTGETLSLTGLVAGPGTVVEIDMRQRTVLQDGGNIFGLLGLNSVFWGLEPGNNSILLTTTNGSDTVTGTLSWRSGTMGI